MNKKVFYKLIQLNVLLLENNYCIDEAFRGVTQLRSLKRKVNEECGYDESQPTTLPMNQLEDVLCENFAEIERDEFFQICLLNDTTTIESMNATISTERDGFIKGLWFNSNKNIFYLPIHVVQKFPNLAIFHADDCNVKQISSANFKGLSKLKRLSLEHNQIQTMMIDTFNDLVNLEFLSLGKKIKIRCPSV
jgi:Leucine-rich repeat (LRR) protein